MQRILLCLLFIQFTSLLPARVIETVISELDEAYGTANLNEFPNNWRFLWNPTGVPIGDSENYEPLRPRSDDWFEDSINATGTDGASNNILSIDDTNFSRPPQYDEIGTVISGRTAEHSTDGLDHYIIFSYTVQDGEEGPLAIRGFLRANTRIQVRVYLDDELVSTRGGDIYLGNVSAGQTIYLAILNASSTDDRNSRRIFFNTTIVRYDFQGDVVQLEPAEPIRITNHLPGQPVSYSLPFLHGMCHPEATSISIRNITSDKPMTEWPVMNGHYKGMVQLQLGNNLVALNDGFTERVFPMTYEERSDRANYRAVYYLASDSTGEFQSPFGEPNDIASAQKRLGVAMLMIQSACAEIQANAGFSRTTFGMDLQPDGMPIVDVVVSENPFIQSVTTEASHNALDNIVFYNRIRRQIIPISNNEVGFMAVPSFSRYDPSTRTVVNHTALGIGSLALYGSAQMYTWAESIEEVSSHLQDETVIDRSVSFDDSGGRGTFWGNYSTALGVMMHELGHVMGLPDTSGDSTERPLPDSRGNYRGIMSRGFDDFHLFVLVRNPQVPDVPYVGTDTRTSFLLPSNLRLLRDDRQDIFTGIAPVSFSDWRNHFDGATRSQLRANNDLDGDGLNNLMEFALGRDPVNPRERPVFFDLSADENRFEFKVTQRVNLNGQPSSGVRGINRRVGGITTSFEVSSDLINWTRVDAADLSILEVNRIGANTEEVTYRINNNRDTPARYVRLRAE